MSLRRGGFAANPIIYHLLTDRFCDANPGRDAPYGRDPYSRETGAFHGGNFNGVTLKLQEGWFDRLGVNAILISPPYEQIHGWVPGGEAGFRHYAYHGYYALDFTLVERSYGTLDELRALVTCAHAQGIAILFDVVMNHPGYADPLTLHQLGIAATRPGWEDAAPGEAAARVDHTTAAMSGWWGGAWVRGDMPGCAPGGADDLTMTVSGLPDFRTESIEHVRLPDFLRNKADTRAVDLPEATVSDYLVSWLCAWVRELGVDGFRCDTARHVDLPAWKKLKTAATHALRAWKAEHADEAMNDAPFWMMGEVFGSGIARSVYHDNGFDSLLNFQFQHDLSTCLDDVYRRYAEELHAYRHLFVSYVSSHDTALHPRDDLVRAALALLLAPGGVLIFYGDETARAPSPLLDGDRVEGTRAPMAWDAVDASLLAYWQRLGQFRARHRALAHGIHRRLGTEPYAFSRFDAASGDLVVVALDVPAGYALPLGGLFHDGEPLRDGFSGRELVMQNGAIALFAAPVVLIERGARRVAPLPP